MKFLLFSYIICTFFTTIRLEDEIFTLFEKPKDLKNITNETLETTTPLSESFTTNIINTTTDDMSDFINSTYSTISEETTTVSSGKKKKKKEKKRSKSVTTKKNETCNCDLWFNSCDINCCCDEDCTNDDKNVFTKCIDDDKKITDEWNLKYCSSKKLVYRNNTPWYMEQKSNSLFCVYKDNLPPKLIKNHYKVITSNEEMEEVSQTFLTWSWMKRNKKNQINLSKSYKYSDDVWIIYNKTLQQLSLPISQIKGHCDSEINMKFMMDYKMSCENSSNLINLNKLHDNLLNSHIVASPENFNESWTENIAECPKNICIQINHFSCINNNCQPINKTNETLNLFSKQLQLVLFVNGSMGYVNASLFINTEPNNPIFEIKHYWVRKNSTLVPKQFSGNPGYKIGKPIIVSTMDGNSSQDTDSLVYFTKNDSFLIKNQLFYPLSVDGFCYLSNTSYNVIKFKENIQTNCKISVPVDFQNNATVLCNSIHDKFLSYIGSSAIGKQEKLFISSIGSPVYDLKSWIDLIYDYEPYDRKGLFVNNDTIKCTNIATKFSFEFAFASIINPTFKKQNNILGARLKIISENVEFSIKNDKIKSVLSLSVRFLDLTTSQVIEYAKGPNFHINLPTDFFYPFSLNSANVGSSTNIVFFTVTFLCFKLF